MSEFEFLVALLGLLLGLSIAALLGGLGCSIEARLQAPRCVSAG